MEKPSLPKGTRDFGPQVMARRNYIIDTIRAVFQKFGFLPLETPAMENLTTLTGKYGDEGDQLLFRILNSGDYLKKVAPESLTSRELKSITPAIADKGLRYDLTVPFARFVVMNKHEIAFPFKRYQIQPVWRGDNPQKGRYREFYQCDADVVGTRSLLCEAEIILMIREVFAKLQITNYTIKINHRGILSGIAQLCGAAEKESALFVAIDKLDKQSREQVTAELLSKGFTQQNIDTLFVLLDAKGSTTNKLAFLATKFETTPEGRNGLIDLREVLNLLNHGGTDEAHLEFDTSLARGLSYYTGCIFEVKIHDSGVGSVSGGGRYDNLTAAFGDKENLSGVGFSFGIDRLYDALETLNLFPDSSLASTEALVCAFDEASFHGGLKVLASLRAAGIRTEAYPEVAKMKKQLDYANKRNIRWVVLIGSDELATGNPKLKDLISGDQWTLTPPEIISKIRS